MLSRESRDKILSMKIDKGKSIFQIICFVAVFAVIVFFLYNKSYPSKLILGGKVFTVEVADTAKLLEKGLSDHIPLKSDEGMLFVFQKEDKYGFWMKDMLFSIDILWIDSNLKIVHIEKSLRPETYPKIFYPNSVALYVLELKAGEVQNLNLKIGDSLEIVKK